MEGTGGDSVLAESQVNRPVAKSLYWAEFSQLGLSVAYRQYPALSQIALIFIFLMIMQVRHVKDGKMYPNNKLSGTEPLFQQPIGKFPPLSTMEGSRNSAGLRSG